MVLPNALISEFGIINYLHSQYSNRCKNNNSFFDENLDTDISPTKIIFDNKLGSWPNSVRHGGSHLFSPFYDDYLDYREASIHLGKNHVSKYIYFIKVSPHIDNFIGVNLAAGSKLNGEYFWKHMSAEALEDAQQRRAIILLDYAQENFIERATYQNLHEALRLSGIPKEQIILIFNSFNAQELYESWFTPIERRLEVRNLPFVMSASSFHHTNNPTYRMTEDIFQDTKNRIRKNHFLFKINRCRNHRMALLYKMSTDKLLEKGDWSCLTPSTFSNQSVQHVASLFQFDINLNIIEELYKGLPHSLESECIGEIINQGAWSDLKADAHIDSYFDICSETFIHGEYKSLTEKVFKPIVNFQPFLFVAWPGSLQVLKDLGFKTFSPFINEEYDNEKDQVKRMNMIYAEIVRLCAMSKEDIHAWYWNMEEILIHNHRHFLQIYKDEPLSIALIDYLGQRVST